MFCLNKTQYTKLIFLPLQCLTGSRGWAGYSSTAAATQSSSGGLFSWLTGEHSSSLSPLDSPLKNVTLPSPLPDYVEPGKTRITTLPNGIRIASETSAVGNNFTCFTFIPKASVVFDISDDNVIDYAYLTRPL